MRSTSLLAVALVAVTSGGSGVGVAHGLVSLRSSAVVIPSPVDDVSSRALHAAGAHAAKKPANGAAAKPADAADAAKAAKKKADAAAKAAARDAKVAGLKKKIAAKEKALARKQKAEAEAKAAAGKAAAGGDAAKAEVAKKLDDKLKADVAAIQSKLDKAEAKMKALLGKGKTGAAKGRRAQAVTEPPSAGGNATVVDDDAAVDVAPGVPAMLDKIDAALDLGMDLDGVSALAGALAEDVVLSEEKRAECSKFLPAGTSWPAAVLNPGAAGAIDALCLALPVEEAETMEKLEHCVSDNHVPQVKQVMDALKAGMENGMPAELVDTVLSQLMRGKVDAATARSVQQFTPADQQLPAAVLDSSSGSPSGSTGVVIGSIAAVVAVGAALVVYQRRAQAAAQSTNVQTYRDEYL
jgi:hypothetical protein